MTNILSYYGVKTVDMIDPKTWVYQKPDHKGLKQYPFATVVLDYYGWVATLAINEKGEVNVRPNDTADFKPIDQEDIQWLKDNLDGFDYDGVVDDLIMKLAELESAYVIANGYDWEESYKTPMAIYAKMKLALLPQSHDDSCDDRGPDKDYYL